MDEAMTTTTLQKIIDAPVAWARKWFIDGERPKKERNENGRMAWPVRFKFNSLSEIQCMRDDVPLFTLSQLQQAYQAGRKDALDGAIKNPKFADAWWVIQELRRMAESEGDK